MIKHIVLLAFAARVDEAKIKHCLEKLGNLKNTEIPQIKSFSYGKNSSPESLDHGFNYAFIMEFLTAADRDFYVNHASHKNIAKNEILPLLANGINSAIVLDYVV